MAWFRCFIRGENFPGDLWDEPSTLKGFYTTRWVNVAGIDGAEAAVVKLLRRDSDLLRSANNPNNKRAKFYIDEVAAARHRKHNGAGFTWFTMGDDEAERSAKRLERGALWLRKKTPSTKKR